MLGLAYDRKVLGVSSLFSLLIRCPYGIEANKACPFYKFRQLDELKKFYLAENFSERQQQRLLSKHYKCYYNREGVSGSHVVS